MEEGTELTTQVPELDAYKTKTDAEITPGRLNEMTKAGRYQTRSRTLFFITRLTLSKSRRKSLRT